MVKVVRCGLFVGNPYFFHKLVIDYGYWLDLLTISLENSRVFCFPNELRFTLLQNIVKELLLLSMASLSQKSLSLSPYWESNP